MTVTPSYLGLKVSRGHLVHGAAEWLLAAGSHAWKPQDLYTESLINFHFLLVLALTIASGTNG